MNDVEVDDQKAVEAFLCSSTSKLLTRINDPQECISKNSISRVSLETLSAEDHKKKRGRKQMLGCLLDFVRGKEEA